MGSCNNNSAANSKKNFHFIQQNKHIFTIKQITKTITNQNPLALKTHLPIETKKTQVSP